jgi:CHAT domain-containing protein
MVTWKGILAEGLRAQAVMNRALGDNADVAAIRRLQTLRSQLGRWASARASVSEASWQLKAHALVSEIESLERQLIQHNATPSSDRTVTLQALQHSLRQDEAFVDIYKYDQFDETERVVSRYAAIITGRSFAPIRVDLGPADALERTIAVWLNSLAGESNARWSNLGKALWRPIKRVLPKTTRRVRVSPDGQLSRIPWHQLELAATSPAIQITEVDSARSLIDSRRDGHPQRLNKTILVVGDVDYDAGRTKQTPLAPGQPFPPLRWAAAESEAIQQLAKEAGLDVTWLKRADASVPRVLSSLSASSFIHFATHGFANGEQERGLSGRGWSVGTSPRFMRDPLIDSGLALSGANVRDPVSLESSGVLSAAALLEADLSENELVVVSACQTGLGLVISAQGVMGLRSAISAAGGRRFLVSLWSVDDEATQILMTEFYRGLWVYKRSLVQALHSAQAKVREDARFRAAQFWAGWSVIDGSSMDENNQGRTDDAK